MENNNRVRYLLEHRFIPQLLYSENSQRFILTLLKGRGSELVRIMGLIGNADDYRCPYAPEDFIFKPMLVDLKNGTQCAIMEIDMPAPEEERNCSRVYICHDQNLGNPRYYTVEKTKDGSFMLCGWGNKGHYNYGTAPDTIASESQRVIRLYMEFLTNGELLPGQEKWFITPPPCG